MQRRSFLARLMAAAAAALVPRAARMTGESGPICYEVSLVLAPAGPRDWVLPRAARYITCVAREPGAARYRIWVVNETGGGWT